MSEQDRRPALVQELRDALEEVARLSEMMSVLLATHVLDRDKLRELRIEVDAAKARAAQLRAEIESLDALSSDDGIPVPTN